jgi:single stranded DNA-binding protein
MFSSKNHVDLIGFVGGKPELRRTKTSKKLVTSFGLALNESWTDKNGERQEADTLWVKIRCWGRQAEVMAEYLEAGKLINVMGKLVKAEAWENRDGELDAQTVVQAMKIIFLDRAPQDEDEDERPARRSTSRKSTRRSSSRNATTTRKSSSRKSSAIEDLSEEEVEELLAVLKERDEKPAKRSSKPPVEVEADEDQGDASEDVEEIDEEEKPAKPRQTRKQAPFARAKK